MFGVPLRLEPQYSLNHTQPLLEAAELPVTVATIAVLLPLVEVAYTLKIGNDANNNARTRHYCVNNIPVLIAPFAAIRIIKTVVTACTNQQH
jgi:hypothetical protein